jgi:hypothetical protein
MRNFLILVAFGFVLLLTGGCGNLSVNFTETTSPQFWAIENQTQAQRNQIEAAVQANQIPFTVGEGLTINDEIIRRLNHQFRDQSSGAIDLSPSQAVFLGHMLKDNDRAFTDAVENIDDWRESFSQEDAFIQNNRSPLNQDFMHFSQRARFIVYLNMRLKEDSAKAQSLAQSGQLAMEPAQDLQAGLNDVRNKAVEDYYSNGRLDLSVDQIFQLRRMLADSYAALNPPQAPVYGGGGSYNIPPNNWSNHWTTNAPAGASGYTYYNSPANGSGQKVARTPTPNSSTPNPTAIPTATPNPGRSGALENLRLNHRHPGSNPYSVPSNPPTATSTPIPPAPAPTNTPLPIEVNSPTPVPMAIPVNTPVPTIAPANTPVPTATSASGEPGNGTSQNNPENGSSNNPPSNSTGHGNHSRSNEHRGGMGDNSGADNSNSPAPQDTPTATADDSATGPGN